MYGYRMVLLILFFWWTSTSEVKAFSNSLKTESNNWAFETSGGVEKIVKLADGWNFYAGGEVASSHYSRVKYKLPEKYGQVLKSFYIKVDIELPVDFYDKQKAGFRIINTDNFGTVVGGKQYGAKDASELRSGVYINSDHSLQIVINHETVSRKVLWSGERLSVGRHVVEFYGNVVESKPWGLIVDGKKLVSGVDILSPSSVPIEERVITRMVAGIDGAASQDSNAFNLILREVLIADIFPTSVNQTTAITATLIPTIATVVVPTTKVDGCLQLRKNGDADCDGDTDVLDYAMWYKQFFDGGKGIVVNINWEADFSGPNGIPDSRVDAYDYALWFRGKEK